MKEEKYMRRCIQLAKNGLCNVSPNPMVGAVIVCEGQIIGEDVYKRHQLYGMAWQIPSGLVLRIDRQALIRYFGRHYHLILRKMRQNVIPFLPSFLIYSQQLTVPH